jgi:hypothetical protein
MFFCSNELFVSFSKIEVLIDFLLQGLRDKTTLNLQNESDGSSRDPDEEANDCLKDRKNALEDKSVS